MEGEQPYGDPRTIWQNQQTERSPMTMLLIRNKTRELRTKTRGERLKSISGPLIVVVLGVIGLHFPDAALGWVFAFAIVWSLAGQYFFQRGLRPASTPEDAALSASLASYRREVERRRFLFSRSLKWNLGPVLLVIATWISMAFRIGILDRTTLPKAAPFLILMGVWLVALAVVRIRQQRDLQREIDELDEIEAANE